MKPVYKRILLKLSGEGLMGDKSFGMSADVIKGLAEQIKAVHDCGVEVCIVVGGGNIFRGAKEASKGMNRTVADHVGMLATVMNALYIQNALEEIGTPARVLSGLNIPEVCEHYIYRRALRHLEKGRVVILRPVPEILILRRTPALRSGHPKCSAMLFSKPLRLTAFTILTPKPIPGPKSLRPSVLTRLSPASSKSWTLPQWLWHAKTIFPLSSFLSMRRILWRRSFPARGALP